MNNIISLKVTGIGEHGKFFDNNAYRDAVNYIADPAKAAYVGGCNISSVEHAAEEMQQTAETYGKNSGKRVRHSIVSFGTKSDTSAEDARAYAEKIVQYYQPEYQTVYAVHQNTDNVHIHLVMNQISYVDGHRYRGKKQDFYAFKKHISEVTHSPVVYVK